MEKHIVITFSKGKTSEAFPMLQTIGGGRMISVHYEKPVSMVKKDRETGEPNELIAELVESKVTIQAQTNVSYTNKKKKTNPDFKAESLEKFGQTYLDEFGEPTESPSNVIKYKGTGNIAFRVFPKKDGIKSSYFVNGKPATQEQIEIIRRNKSGGKRSGEVSIMNIGLNNIKKIKADSQEIIFK